MEEQIDKDTWVSGKRGAGGFLIYRNTSSSITQLLPSCSHLPAPPTRPFSAPPCQMVTYLWTERGFTDKDEASAKPTASKFPERQHLVS